jgi:hypothetical protein
VVISLLRGWDAIFAREWPHAVVADFAPACLLAAAGRIPAVAIGGGYAVPPAEMAEFPVLRADVVARKHDERKLIGTVNGALHETGRPEIAALPAVFKADRVCVTSYRETDPYASLRTAQHLAPFLPPWNRQPAREGREIFVYFPEFIASYPAVLYAIAQLAVKGRAVRLFVPRLPSALAAQFRSRGVEIETQPVPLDQIAERTSLLVFHGSLGTASFALAAGIPQVIVSIDTEKTLVGQAVERLGAGRHVRLAKNNPLEGPLLAQLIVETASDAMLSATARGIAPQFASRLMQPPAARIAEIVDELAGAKVR